MQSSNEIRHSIWNQKHDFQWIDWSSSVVLLDERYSPNSSQCARSVQDLHYHGCMFRDVFFGKVYFAFWRTSEPQNSRSISRLDWKEWRAWCIDCVGLPTCIPLQEACGRLGANLPACTWSIESKLVDEFMLHDMSMCLPVVIVMKNNLLPQNLRPRVWSHDGSRSHRKDLPAEGISISLHTLSQQFDYYCNNNK